MQDLSLGEDIFEWTGISEVLLNPYWKISLTSPARVVEVRNNANSRGIVLLGAVEAVVDSIISTSKGAVGNTTIFTGTNMVILGLTIEEIQESLIRIDSKAEASDELRKNAEAMITKLQNRLRSSDFNMKFDADEECDYIIFGRRNFLLVSGREKFVLVHRQQISVRTGESKLVQIDPVDGILVASKKRVLNLGNLSPTFNLGGMIGEFGVNITSSVLDHILWD